MARLITAAAAALLQAAQPDSAPRTAPPAPLFASHDPLSLTIEAPLATIFRDRGAERREHPGKLVLETPGGQRVTLDIQIRTRGNTRLKRRICQFPPLRLEFDAAQVAGTVFEIQDEIKLVTHCQDRRPEHEQYVLQEYLAYRAFNRLTEISFRARLARITYVDSEAKRDTVTRFAFFLEHEDAMARRNGWEALLAPVVPPDVVDPSYLSLVEVFQYMIGNPDWSAYLPEPDEDECCHNTQPVGSHAGPVFSVPYDFDITGVVNTRYANRVFQPRQRGLGINTVRQRFYWGRCASALYLPAAIKRFIEERDAIFALYREQPDLDPKVLAETLSYLDEFYTIITDPKKVDRELNWKCRRY